MALGGGGGGGGSARGVRAGAAYVELGAKDNLTANLKTIAARFMNFGKQVAAVGALAVGGGLGIALAGITAAAGPLVDTLKELGQLDTTAKAFGLTGREASGLFGVLAAGGSDIRDATEGLVTLGQRVSDAMGGKGEEAAELFRELGVGAEQFAGLNPAEQFYKLHEAILAVQDPAKRVQLLLKAVGEDTGKNLVNTLSMSNAELRGMAGRLAFSNAELKQAADAARAYQSATLAVQRAWQQVAVAVAPAVQEISGWVERGATAFTGWLQGRDIGNVLAEVGVRLEQLLLEAQFFGRDAIAGLWKYATTDSGKFFDVLKEAFAGVVNYAAGTFAKLFPVITRGLIGAVKAGLMELGTLKTALGDTAGAEQIKGAILAMDEDRMLRDIQAAQERGALELAESMKLAGAEWEKLSKRFKESTKNNATADADDRKRLTDKLQPILDAAEAKRGAAQFAEFMADLMAAPPDLGAAGGKVADVGRVMGTFGANPDFLSRSFGVQSAEKTAVGELKKGNKLAEKQVEVLQRIEKKDNVPRITP